MMRKLITASGFLAIFATQANAATATGNLAASVTISAICNAISGTLNFGTPSNIGGAANIDATGSLTVTCTNTVPYQVTLANGANFLAGSRRMANVGATAFINYSIFSDAARTIAWTGATFVSGTGNGAAQAISVFGRIPTGQTSVPTGAYTDTVQITVTY